MSRKEGLPTTEQGSGIRFDPEKARQGDLEGFKSVVTGAIEQGQSPNDLAREFEVSEMVVKGWAKGTARPHPRIQEYVVDKLKKPTEEPSVNTPKPQK
jgi:hypothetical protein